MEPDVARWDDARASKKSWSAVGLVSGQFFIWPYLASLAVGAFAIDCKSWASTGTSSRSSRRPTGPSISSALLKTLGNSGDTARGFLIADSVMQGAGPAIGIAALKAAQRAGEGSNARRGSSFQLGARLVQRRRPRRGRFVLKPLRPHRRLPAARPYTTCRVRPLRLRALRSLGPRLRLRCGRRGHVLLPLRTVSW